MHRLLRNAVFFAGALSTISCVNPPAATAPVGGSNPRIEYRSLTAAARIRREPISDVPAEAPVVHRSEETGDTRGAASEGTRPPAPSSAPVFIDFANESATLNSSELDVAQLKAEHDLGKHFFVVGQSHGMSSVGVQTLAVKRAQSVSQALLNAGIDASRIHTLASWSQTRESFAPPRGVQIFVVEPGNEPSRALLALQGS